MSWKMFPFIHIHIPQVQAQWRVTIFHTWSIFGICILTWNPNDPGFDWSLGLVLGGWPSNIEVIWVPGTYIHILYFSRMKIPPIRSFRFHYKPKCSMGWDYLPSHIPGVHAAIFHLLQVNSICDMTWHIFLIPIHTIAKSVEPHSNHDSDLVSKR